MENFEKYKSKKQQTEAYKLASQIQENFAFIGQATGQDTRQYEGHLAAMDVLNKIDSMVKMFEKTIQDNPSDKSSQKIVDVVSALYDLAQSKLIEAKKQCTSYMKKASGFTPAPSKPKPTSSFSSSPTSSSATSNVPATTPQSNVEDEYIPDDNEEEAEVEPEENNEEEE